MKRFITEQRPVGTIMVALAPDIGENLKDHFRFNADALRHALEQGLSNYHIYDADQRDTGLRLKVSITRVRIRSEESVALWGPMAGGDSLEGHVVVTDGKGEVQHSFQVSVSYALGEAAALRESRMDWLYETFTKRVIETVMGLKSD